MNLHAISLPQSVQYVSGLMQRPYDGAGDEGGAGPGASYERVTMAGAAGGAGPGGSRAGATPRCMRICSTTAGSGQDAARMTPAETGLVATGYSIARRGQLRSCAEVVWTKC